MVMELIGDLGTRIETCCWLRKGRWKKGWGMWDFVVNEGGIVV
jgi:hypothetical protein